jgi:hypothetical protein
VCSTEALFLIVKRKKHKLAALAIDFLKCCIDNLQSFKIKGPQPITLL